MTIPPGFRIVSQPQADREDESIPAGFRIVQQRTTDPRDMIPTDEPGTGGWLTREQADQQEQARLARRSAEYGRDMGLAHPFSVLGIAQGFNLSDELVGLLARSRGLPAGPAAEEERARVQYFREEYPVSTFVNEAAGGAMLTGGIGGAVRAAAPRLAASAGQFAANRPIMAAGLTGAAGGGIAGAGDGETPMERVQRGGVGAALGGVLGAAVPIAGRAVNGPLRQAISRGTGQADDAVPNSVQRFLSNIPEETQGQMTPPRRGPEFIGEMMGPRGERIMTDLAQGDDAAANIARQATRARAQSRSQRVMAEVQARTGSRRGVSAIADRRAAEQAAKPLFREVDQTPVPVNGRLREIVRRASQENVNVSGTAARQPSGELRLDALLTDDPFDGAVSGQTVRALISDIQDAKTTAFRQGGGNAGTRLAGLERELRGYLGDEVPAFRQASGMWRDARLDDEAFRLGTQVFDEGRNRAFIETELRDFVGSMDDMSASERGQFLSGVLDAVERRTASTAQGGNAGSRLTRDGIRDRLSIVFGDQADELSDVLSREGYTASLDRMYDPTVGSQTAARQMSDGAANQALRGQGSRYVGDVIENTSGATLGRARQGLSRAFSAASPAERERLSQLMFAPITDEELARQMSQMIRRSRQRAGLFGGASAYGGMMAGQQAVNQN